MKVNYHTTIFCTSTRRRGHDSLGYDHSSKSAGIMDRTCREALRTSFCRREGTSRMSYQVGGPHWLQTTKFLHTSGLFSGYIKCVKVKFQFIFSGLWLIYCQYWSWCQKWIPRNIQMHSFVLCAGGHLLGYLESEE
ncbi:uncharacterized protein LOC120642685 isoform X2 [Panicum virgatum]|uniref:uncharacterized protein LOC120642685 isoform X2 n=1 Tax=Panicum virgatum TaxID=38727 RepID=UPI0019D4F6F2|nr:uncharacterized protein LOC120642685 isoform X2 [Panicum virgatum]